MTVTFKDPVAVPHKYRNRYLRDGGTKSSAVGGSSQSGGGSVDLSAYLTASSAEATYLTKTNAEATYLKKVTFDDMFELATAQDGITKYIRAKYTMASDGDLVAFGYDKSEQESGGSVVTWSQIVTSGTKIAQIKIGSVTTDIYAPNGGGSGAVNSWEDIVDRPSWLDSYLGTNKPPLTAFAKAGTCITIGSDSSINIDARDLAENELDAYFASSNHEHSTSDIDGLGSLATKSSLSFSELSSHPTTLSGYGITDALSTSGGQMSGSLDMNGKTIECVSKITGYDNDYTGSSGAEDTVIVHTGIDACMGFYDSVNFINGDQTGYNYIVFGSGQMKLASAVSVGTSASCTGNSATATKLQTSRLLWGRSFDGSGNVQGNMENVGSISFNSGLHEYIDNNGNIHLGQNSGAWNIFTGSDSAALHILNSNGYIGVNNLSPECRLDVVGDVKINGKLRIGDAYLTYNADNGALVLDNGQGGTMHLCATGDLVAYGVEKGGIDNLTDFSVKNTLTVGDKDYDINGVFNIYSESWGESTEIRDMKVIGDKLHLFINGNHRIITLENPD